MLSRLVSAYENKIKYFKDKTFTDLRKHIEITYGDLSFLSFIKYIIEDLTSYCSLASCLVDVHWRPFYDVCGYCDLEFDVIGTLDEFTTDIFYISQKLNLPEVFNLTLQANSAPPLPDSLTRQEKTVQFFKQLQKEQILKLQHMYRLDFELFGYSADMGLN